MLEVDVAEGVEELAEKFLRRAAMKIGFVAQETMRRLQVHAERYRQ